MDTRTRSGVVAAAAMRGVCSLLMLASLSGCAVLRSAYVTQEDVNACTGSAAADACCTTAATSGEKAAECTSRAFEHALQDHAVFANAIGEMLIPLASLVAYKGFSGGNEHNIAALASGGAAMYGVSNYAYKKPREAIYLLGLSGIGCATRLTALRTLDIDDAHYLEGLTGAVSNSTAPSPMRQRGADSAEQARVALRTAIETRDLFATVVEHAAARPFPTACNRNDRAGFEQDRLAAASRLPALGHEIDDLRQRLAQTESNALRLLRSHRKSDQDLLHAVQRIRTDVNHMLAAQTPDPAALKDALAVLKLPAAPAAPVESSEDPAPESPAGEAAIDMRSAAFVRSQSAAVSRSPGKSCDAAAASRALKSGEEELRTRISEARRMLAAIEGRIALSTPSEDQQSPVHETCAIANVEAPQPFRVLDGGAVEIVQGSSRRIPVSGGRVPYNAVVGSDPAAGSIKAAIVGDAALGRALDIKVAAETTAGEYNVIAWDGSGAQHTIKLKVLAAPDA